MNHIIQHAVASALALAAASTALASPEGGTVVGGNASITRTPGNTTINQSSQNAALDWQSFNVGVGEAVRFVQPNSSAVALNRVLGSDPTNILGTLSANGKVFLVNPNGVLFGKSAQVNVGGLVASTRGIALSDFLAGRYKFNGTSDGAVLNQGSIKADGGYVALLGARVSNEGVIAAKLGTVALAAGSAITLDVAGDGMLSVAVNAGSVDALVQNGGLIQANGGQVLLTAQSASGLMQSAVNNTGVIEAQTIENHRGTIRLMGDMQAGTASVGGTLDASAPDGGDGGFVETSAAHVQVASNARVTTAAPDGPAGEWLIDPVDFTVAASDGDITGAVLSSALGMSNVVIQSTSGSSGSAGDVNVNDAVSWSANQLTLNAQNNVNINSTMNGSGTASLAFEYGQGAVAASNTSRVNVQAPVNLPTGNNFSMKLGSDGPVYVYSVINDMTALQAMNSNLSGKFALGSNLDASGVTGFVPIGPRADYWDGGNNFAGTFDGLGHTISNLTIDLPGNPYVGLFNTIDGAATVRNIGLVNANISGYGLVGALAGWSYGTVSNTYATGGSVTGHEYAGGLLGYQQGGLTENSYANVAVSGAEYGSSTGGLVGRDEGGLILNTYATGTVSGDKAGGLVGECANCFVTDSYAAGAVTNPYNGWTGGLIGAWYFTPVVTNSYWNVTTTGQLTSPGDGSTGLTTAQLQAALPTGFSATAWGNGGNKTTPYLLGNPGPVMLSTDSSGAYYQIVLSLEQLQNMSSNLSRNYALGNDIDASVTSTWNSGAGFTPVGTGTPYTGNFDGLDHVIRNLYIDLPGSLFVGLFSDARGALRNVAVEDSNITGNAYVGPLAGTAGGLTTNAHASGTVVSVNNAGGLVGNNDGTIRYSYSSASASGGWSGGLAGNNNASGQIFDSYATGHVNGGSSGGLIGSNYGHATNVYATGYVTGNSNGGLVGSHGGPVVNGYWDTQTSNQSSSSGNDGSPRTTAQLQAGLPSGFSSSVWGNAGNRTTPYLLGNAGPVLISSDASATYYNVILTLDQLQAMSSHPAGNYVLGGNLDAAASSGWNGGAGFAPVGTGSAFSGIFDGFGYTVSNLTIDRPSEDDVGLFGVTNGATIRDIGLFNASVTGRTNVGALAGASTASSIGTTYSSGTVDGFSAVGGLIGVLHGGSTRDSYSSASVSGTFDLVGGLVGQADNSATISTSYAGGTLNAPGATNVGGLAGEINGGAQAIASFWNVTANNGLDPVTGGVGAGDPTGATGVTAAGLTAQASFTPQGSAANEWNFANTWIMYEGQTAPLLRRFMTPLTVTTNNAIKTYDGLAYSGNPGVTYSTTPNLSNLSGTLTFSGGTNVGNSALTAGGLFSNQQGYLISYASGTLTVNPYIVDLTGTRAYDGTTAFSASQLMLGTLANGETLTLAGTGTVASKDVGSGMSVSLGTLALVNGTGLASNYTLVGGTRVASITPAILTVAAGSASKVYDGDTLADVTLDSFTGLVGTETVAAAGPVTGTFNSKNVADATQVTIGSVTLADGTNGGLASNYSFASGQTVAGTITAKALTATANASDKVYDGNTTAVATLTSLTGLVGSETLGATGTATFNSKDVADANLVTINSTTLTDGANGGLASNYSLASGQVATAHITRKALTVVGQAASDKVYDGTTAATLAGGTLAGVVGGETVSLDQAGEFVSAEVGDGIAVTANDSLSGAAAVNYSVIQPLGLAANITAIPQVPQVPEVPQVPDVPQVPETPQVPDVPQVPETPQVPDTPQVPEVPQTPETPQGPGTPDAPIPPISVVSTESYRSAVAYATNSPVSPLSATPAITTSTASTSVPASSAGTVSYDVTGLNLTVVALDASSPQTRDDKDDKEQP